MRASVEGIKKHEVLVRVATGSNGIGSRGGSCYRGSANTFCTRPRYGTSVCYGRPFFGHCSLDIFAALHVGVEGDSSTYYDFHFSIAIMEVIYKHIRPNRSSAHSKYTRAAQNLKPPLL